LLHEFVKKVRILVSLKNMSKYKKLEQLELDYFKKIEIFLIDNIHTIIKGLDSKNRITGNWKKEFENTSREGYRASVLDTGAERIFYDLFPVNEDWEPNSSPIGSDLMYETKDAFVHIDIKTVSISGNFGDAQGECEVQKNQTSYPTKLKFSGPSLPTFYQNKPCLTYLIQIVNDSQNKKGDIFSITLLCIPNGKFYKIYKEKIIKAGKTGLKNGYHTDFRFKYFEEPHFLLLSDKGRKEFRVSLIYFDNSNHPSLKEIDLLKNAELVKRFKKGEE